jgi:trans-aconitate methyltransferase
MKASAPFWDGRAEEPLPWDANGWARSESQRARFRAAERWAKPLRNAGWSERILDYGCGTGGLFDFLYSPIRYLGVDRSGAMLARAEREHPQAEFLTADWPMLEALGPWDCCFALGVWNLAEDEPQAFEDMERLWGLTARVLVASLLRERHPSEDSRHPGLRDPERPYEASIRYDAASWAAWASERASRWAIDASYLANDFCVVLWR